MLFLFLQGAVSDAEVAQLREEVSKLKSDLEIKDNELHSAQSKATTIDEQLKNTKNELDTKSANIEQLESRNNASQAELADLREKLTQSNEQLKSAESQLQDVQAQLSAEAQQQNVSSCPTQCMHSSMAQRCTCPKIMFNCPV